MGKSSGEMREGGDRESENKERNTHLKSGRGRVKKMNRTTGATESYPKDEHLRHQSLGRRAKIDTAYIQVVPHS